MVASDDDAIENALAAVTASQWTHLQTLVEAVDPRQPGVWEGGEEVARSSDDQPVLSMPYFDYSEALSNLHRALDEYQIIVPIDWMAWSAEHPTALQNLAIVDVSTNDIVKYLVSAVRGDRFSEGHLASEVHSGVFLSALLVLIQRQLELNS